MEPVEKLFIYLLFNRVIASANVIEVVKKKTCTVAKNSASSLRRPRNTKFCRHGISSGEQSWTNFDAGTPTKNFFKSSSKSVRKRKLFDCVSTFMLRNSRTN